MNSNQSQGQRHQQPRQDSNSSPGQQRAKPADDIGTPRELPEGSDVAPVSGDNDRTPWQQQPKDRPPHPQQGGTLRSEQQRQGSLSEDTDETDDSRATGNN